MHKIFQDHMWFISGVQAKDWIHIQKPNINCHTSQLKRKASDHPTNSEKYFDKLSHMWKQTSQQTRKINKILTNNILKIPMAKMKIEYFSTIVENRTRVPASPHIIRGCWLSVKDMNIKCKEKEESKRIGKETTIWKEETKLYLLSSADMISYIDKTNRYT